MTKLLFIPGYFGSKLKDRLSGKTRWVRISDFFTNKYDLQMSESYSDVGVKNDLVNGDILLKVRVLPKIYEVESYEKTLKHLGHFCQKTNRELHTVTYDWRDDFQHSIQKVANKIYELTASGEKIEVVAHSNGGILISYFLRYGTQDFLSASENWEGTNYIKKISIVASPLHGILSLFKHVKYGTTVLQNKRLMGSLDYTSFKSTYFFLPHENWQKGYIHKKGENLKSLNLHNLETWKKNQWGPYNPGHIKELPVNEEKFQNILTRAQAFQNLMIQNVSERPKEKIKIQVIRGVGLTTFFYPTLKDEESSTYHYPKQDKIDGDGIVAAHSASPLHWFDQHQLRFDTIQSAEHLKIISEYQYQKTIHDFLES
jgi:hypothetical protein